jgi:predicted nucleic acid-binding protein
VIALDTTAIIDLWMEDEALRAVLVTLKNKTLCSTSANCHEVMVGLDSRHTVQKREYNFYKSLFERIVILDHTLEAAEQTNEILHELESKGKTISGLDLMIAGILRANNVTTIVTRNIKHFESIDGFIVIRY